MWALRGWGIPSPHPPLTAPKDVINMAQTSIHFQGVQGGSEEHNKRLKKLDYVHHELSSQNAYWQSDSQESRLVFVTQNAKAKTGRKMQAKATPIREAVVVILCNKFPQQNPNQSCCSKLPYILRF